VALRTVQRSTPSPVFFGTRRAAVLRRDICTASSEINSLGFRFTAIVDNESDSGGVAGNDKLSTPYSDSESTTTLPCRRPTAVATN